jgi:hypothetical protein
MPNDPGKVLVSGALRNVRDNERIAPPVRVALLDAHGAEIGYAIVDIDAAPVLPGKVQGFAAIIADPGARGQGIGVDFVLDRPAPSRAAPVHAPAHGPAQPAPPPAQAPAQAAPAQAQGPAAHTIPVSDSVGLRPALSPGATLPLDMRPVDAVPMAMEDRAAPLDSHARRAVSAGHG